MSKLPIDLSGCKVKQVKWTSRGVQFALAGETSQGTSVEGCELVLSPVANHYELQDFMRNQRTMEKKSRSGQVLDKKTKKWVRGKVVVTIEKFKPYPLKLPATLTHLSISKAAQASYGDAVFTYAHGKPPKAVEGQMVILIALDEKRFHDRKPFPIICEGLMLKDKKGKLLSGKEEPEGIRWSEKKYQQLGLKLFEALATSDRAAVEQMLTSNSRKRVKRLKLEKLAGDFFGVADRMVQAQPRKIKGTAINWFRKMMQVEVELDERLWDNSRQPGDPPLNALRAQLQLCTECLRESLHVYVVEEDSEMRIEL